MTGALLRDPPHWLIATTPARPTATPNEMTTPVRPTATPNEMTTPVRPTLTVTPPPTLSPLQTLMSTLTCSGWLIRRRWRWHSVQMLQTC